MGLHLGLRAKLVLTVLLCEVPSSRRFLPRSNLQGGEAAGGRRVLEHRNYDPTIELAQLPMGLCTDLLHTAGAGSGLPRCSGLQG